MSDSPPPELVNAIADLKRKLTPQTDVSDQVARQCDLTFSFDGGGAPITAAAHCYLRTSFPARLSGWAIVSDVSGTVSFTVNTCLYSGFPGSLASIVAAANPAMITARSASGSIADITTWTDVVPRDTIFEAVLDSTSGTIGVCTLSLRAKRLDL